MAGKVQDWLPNLQGLVENENVKKILFVPRLLKIKTHTHTHKQTNKKKNGDNKAYETRTLSPAEE